MEIKIQELAEALKDNWIENYTLSGREAFRKCEAEKRVIIDEAETLGVWTEVYMLANKLMHGEDYFA
jgi:hypothetical protein